MESSKNINSKADNRKQTHSNVKSSQSSNFQNKQIDKSTRDFSYITESKAAESRGAEIVPSSLSTKPKKSYAAATKSVCHSFVYNNADGNLAENLNTHESDAKDSSASSSNQTSTYFEVPNSREIIEDALKQRYAIMSESQKSNDNSLFSLQGNLFLDSRDPELGAHDCLKNIFNNSNQPSNLATKEVNFASSEKFESLYQDSCRTDYGVQEMLNGVNKNSSKQEIDQVAKYLLKRVDETLKNINKLLKDMDDPLSKWLLKSCSYALPDEPQNVERYLKKNDSTVWNPLYYWPDIRFRLEKLSDWLIRTSFYAEKKDPAASLFCVRDMIRIVVENDKLMRIPNIFPNALMPSYLGDDAKLFLDMRKQLDIIITRLLSIASDIERLREKLPTYSRF